MSDPPGAQVDKTEKIDLKASHDQSSDEGSTNPSVGMHSKEVLKELHQFAVLQQINRKFELVREFKNAQKQSMFEVKLTLGTKTYTGEGPSIKAAQRVAATLAMSATTLPKPSVKEEAKTPGVCSPELQSPRKEGSTQTAEVMPIHIEFLQFVHASPTPFHVVRSVAAMLEKARFQRVTQGDRNAKDVYITHGGSLVAVRRPSCSCANAERILIFAAHTDSPCLKLKPVSKIPACHGVHRLAVQTYGGGIWHTFLDRDLRLSGLALVRSNGSVGNKNEIFERLFDSIKPICRIPNPAIHLSRKQNESLSVNTELHLKPLLYCEASTANIPVDNTGKTQPDIDSQCEGPASLENDIYKYHDQVLISYISSLLPEEPTEIVDIDAYLTDAVPPSLGGICDDFVFSPRLDNLSSCYCAVKAITQMDKVSCTIVIALFNHEEIGSVTDEGAAGGQFEQLLRRAGIEVPGREGANDADNLFIVSLDAAHAAHPNFSDLHECNHKPSLHGGPVIKRSANGHYATTMRSGFLIKEAATIASIPTQEYVNRNDIPCGSTIGPILSARLAVRTVDLGIPILSMHSIREMMSSCAIEQLVKLLKSVIVLYDRFQSRYHTYL